MPPIFSVEEKQEIREELLKYGFEMMHEQGIKKTSINALVKKVGIAKGTFYHFFDSKQDFVMQIIREYQSKKFVEFETEFSRKGEMSIEELFMWYRSIINYKENPLYTITPEDAQWLRESLPKEVIYNEQGDIEVAKLLLSKVKGIRKDVDYAVVANFPKLIFLAIEHKEELHSKVLDKNIEMLLETLKHYLIGGKE